MQKWLKNDNYINCNNKINYSTFMDEWIILQPTVLLNRTFSNLPQQTCFVHFSVSCWWHHISQFRDEHIELISSLFLTQISRPPFSVFFFREVIHFDVKIFTLLSRETKFVFPFSRTRVEQWKRNYFSIRFCFNPPPMPYTLAYYVIIKSWERRREVLLKLEQQLHTIKSLLWK